MTYGISILRATNRIQRSLHILLQEWTIYRMS